MYLKEGSVVGITCPASYVAEERVAYCVKVLEDWGFRVKKGATIGTGSNYFSGTDAERLADLQRMLDDPEVSAVLMGRGGYGTSRLLDRLDFTGFEREPKWVCGFSDVTALHSHIYANYGLPSLHSPMCGHFKPETEHEDFLLSFRKALVGEPLVYPLPPNTANIQGTATGDLIGGNLSLLVHLTGSVSEMPFKGRILFIEDIEEHYYQADRMLLHLKRAGKLADLAGLIVGGFTGMKDTERPFGQTIEQIVLDKVAEYGYPVCFGFPSGHQNVNYTFVHGLKHRLEVGAGRVVVAALQAGR